MRILIRGLFSRCLLPTGMIQCYCLKKQRGLSQEQLGAEIGVTRQTVSKWELGETTPEMDKLIQLGSLFGITLDELVGNETENATFTNYMEQNRRNRGHYRNWKHCKRSYFSWCDFSGNPLIGSNFSRADFLWGTVIGYSSLPRGNFCRSNRSRRSCLWAVCHRRVCFWTIRHRRMCHCRKIAGGGYANASVAIGDKVKGDYTFYIKEPISSEAIKTAILRQYPKTWSVIVEIFQSLFGSL